MSRFALPTALEAGVMDATAVNDAFAALATAINNAANGGDAMDASNLPPRSVPLTGLAADEVELVLSSDLSYEWTLPGTRHGLIGNAQSADFHLGVAPRAGTIVGWSARWDLDPDVVGGVDDTTITLLLNGISQTFVTQASGVLLSAALNIAVAKGDELALRMTTFAVANSHYAFGRAFVHLRLPAIG